MKYERQDKLSDEQRLKDNYGKGEEKETEIENRIMTGNITIRCLTS